MINLIRLMRQFFSNSIQIEMEYRAEFFISALNSLLAFASGFAVLYSIFHNVSSLGGWAFEEGLILFGVFLIIDGFVAMIIRPNLNRISEYIRLGTMDFILLKPINSQFLVSFRFINIWSFPNLLIGWGLVLYGMSAMDTLEMFTIVQFIFMLLPALMIVYSILCVLNTTAFWWVKVDNITMLFHIFFETGRFPITAYPKWIQIGLTFIVPVAFMTTVPAQAAFSVLSFKLILIGWGIAGIALLSSHLFWRFALSKYASASS